MWRRICWLRSRDLAGWSGASSWKNKKKCFDLQRRGAWSGPAGVPAVGRRVQILPDGVVVHGGRQRHKDVPDGVGEGDDAVALEEDDAGAVDAAAVQQLPEALGVVLEETPALVNPRPRRRLASAKKTSHVRTLNQPQVQLELKLQLSQRP